ncbi:DUF4180 domain-containing protein [Portibacter lacus]|uniref:DUF4180 domain-containing protein n=1 Tax=Portibacter lacus TaxID=1099794 RepID=A0AA37WEF4_9BACT|nr:DUF4180 domain-containing protein [Portibacter lacus]GLR17247.1 hypothetical protein GCM10007940_18620 [Portibacter lacus]
MEFKKHVVGEKNVAEIISDQVEINSVEDGKDLLGNVYYQNFDGVIVYKKHITPDFFDLKNGIAGDILQKFSNYRIRLAIIGDFSGFTSQSIRDFIFESNKMGHVVFVAKLEEALDLLGK